MEDGLCQKVLVGPFLAIDKGCRKINIIFSASEKDTEFKSKSGKDKIQLDDKLTCRLRPYSTATPRFIFAFRSGD